MTTPHEHPTDTTPPRRPGVGMRLISLLLGARARRQEGRPVDLARERHLNDRISARLRAPEGVAVTDEVLGGVPVVRMSSGGGARGTVLFLHGGAYVLGSAHQALASVSVCTHGGPDLVSVEYRLAPEHPHPAAVDDALAVYRELVRSPGADRLVVAGGSAGGGLLLLLLQRARDEGLPMPVAAVAEYPWADLSLSGASATANVGRDMLVRSQLLEEAAWFAGGRDLRDPAVSPLFGSFRGLPRTWIPVGTADLLLDDARRVAAAMVADGVDVDLEEWPGAIHAFTALPLREGRLYRRRLRAFVDTALPTPTAPTPQETA
ncbi:MAG: alpha/beta hydrolase fold domain-containing protein [Blastococcus sp.]|nr:alpha/beta hydrolase fold domain-containing protein [Blastococcus sp.]